MAGRYGVMTPSGECCRDGVGGIGGAMAAGDCGGVAGQEKVGRFLKAQICCVMLTTSRGLSIQYCVILEVKDVSEATAVGMLLHRLGCKIVSTQVTPSNCPIQQEASNCEACPVVAKPVAPTVEQLGVRTMVSKRKEEKPMGKVLVFGTFDELNAGHVAFLEQAKRFGDELIVLVVEDEFVIKYKGKKPVWSLKMRMGALRRLPFKATVYEEDIRENWKSLETIQPDVIVLSAEQAGWRHRLDLVLEEYRLPTRIEVLPEKRLETNAAETG